MTAADVLGIAQLFERQGIDFVVDGGCPGGLMPPGWRTGRTKRPGWGVDALLGEQTRPHAGLDIAVRHADVARIRALLEARGFRDVPRDDTWECNFVLGDERGREIDIHSCTFDAAGNNVFGVAYPFESPGGSGAVGGHPVKCITAEWMAKFHSGYKLDENDCRDVKALCRRFGMALPAEYEEFRKKDDDPLR